MFNMVLDFVGRILQIMQTFVSKHLGTELRIG